MGSLASGILTLVGAVTEAIQIDKVIYDGPAELQALFNEGSDLMAILKNINAIIWEKVTTLTPRFGWPALAALEEFEAKRALG
jgi:hypothetical protein